LSRSVVALLAAAIAVCLAADAVGSFEIIAHPPLDHPAHADAIVVLSGDRGGRLPKGLSLVRGGVAPVLVLAGPPDLPEAKALCRAPAGFEVDCLQPDPDTTRTEARAVAALAKQRRWHHVVVVTDEYHVERARLLFDRCVDGAVSVIKAFPAQGVESTWRRIGYEWLAIGYSLAVARSC
jgi:uncharacterized SAM-binding protein YcdF (DUF218 family)